MRTLLRKLFARNSQASRQAVRAPQLGVERLDERLLLSASPLPGILMQGSTTSIAGTGVSATLSGSTLSIQDSGSGETVQVLKSGLQLRVQVTEANGSGHAATSMPLMPVSVGQVRFQSSGQKDSFSNLLGTPSSFSDGSVSAPYAPSLQSLTVYRLSGSDDVGVATLSGSQALYSAQSGSWFLPGGAVTSLVHGGSNVSVQGGDSTYLLHQGSAGDSVATLSVSLHDAGLRKVFVQDATRDYITHGGLTRTDMLDLFTQAGKDGTVSAQELTDLQALVAATGVAMPADVRNLAGKVVNHDTANALFGSASLGDLHAGSSSTQLNELVQKWVYGADLPQVTAPSPYTVHYETVQGPLFGTGGPVYTDVRQGYVGDCYLLSGLAEVAKVNPQAIKDMFHDNGDGTFSVRFFVDDGTGHGVATYVTVNRDLPLVNSVSTGDPLFLEAKAGTSPTSGDGPLWVALAEKAYAQLCGEGVVSTQPAVNSYSSIADNGQPVAALAMITGSSGNASGAWASDGSQLGSWARTWAGQGQYVVLDSVGSPADAGVVPNHVYAYLGYDPTTGLTELYNPWGLNNGTSDPGIIYLTDAQLQQDFNFVMALSQS